MKVFTAYNDYSGSERDSETPFFTDTDEEKER
jgi:hypothetical protein